MFTITRTLLINFEVSCCKIKTVLIYVDAVVEPYILDISGISFGLELETLLWSVWHALAREWETKVKRLLLQKSNDFKLKKCYDHIKTARKG